VLLLCGINRPTAVSVWILYQVVMEIVYLITPVIIIIIHNIISITRDLVTGKLGEILDQCRHSLHSEGVFLLHQE